MKKRVPENLKTVREQLENHGYNPILVHMEIALDMTNSPELRRLANKDLLPFYAPMLKSITHDVGAPTMDRLAQLKVELEVAVNQNKKDY